MLPPGPPGPPQDRTAAPPLSVRAYAARRKTLGLPGGSHQAVIRAIAGGRLRNALTPDGKIADPELADREWAANTDHSKAPGRVKDLAAGERPTALPLEDAEPGQGSQLAHASAREKHFKALLAELTYKQRAGELVDAAEMAAAMADAFSTVRTKLLGLPSKAKQRHPELTLDQLATLDEIVREALEELAREEEVAAA